MRKLGIAVLGALSMTLLTAASALAQDGGNGSPIVPPGGDDVAPEVIVNPPGGVAFTGSEVTVWMVLAVALLAIGVAFLIVARRRGRTADNS
jgi:LPXTG-motif cell wall-anchored protein